MKEGLWGTIIPGLAPVCVPVMLAVFLPASVCENKRVENIPKRMPANSVATSKRIKRLERVLEVLCCVPLFADWGVMDNDSGIAGAGSAGRGGVVGCCMTGDSLAKSGGVGCCMMGDSLAKGGGVVGFGVTANCGGTRKVDACVLS